jgi:23S rRNA pseudouridine1911/1915/1917 synthase
MAELKVIYEDDDILVCHKRAGMATEGARPGEMDVISAARNYIARSIRSREKGRQGNLPPYVATVNRLDKPVEGVLVLAKNKKAASVLSEQIKDRSIKKYYYALCYGIPEVNMDTMTDMLIRREDTGKAFVISEAEVNSLKDGAVTLSTGEKVRLIGGEPKKASLHYQIIGRTDRSALLRIHLETGRYHQIRAQLSSRGYPILGDRDYGTGECLDYSKEAGIRNICLVAYQYDIRHPGTGREMSFKIRPENDAIVQLLK